MNAREEWEQKIKRELQRKRKIVHESPTRPSEGLIQQRLKTYGDNSYESVDLVDQALREFVNLKHNEDEFYKEKGGPLHFCMKMKQLHNAHEQCRKDIVTNLEMFVLAHEWYEILVAADEAQELERLAFLHRLNQETFYEPSKPEDYNYPQPVEVHRDYEKSSVVRMVRCQLVRLDALLQEEKTNVEEAESQARVVRKFEEQTMSDLRYAMMDLQEAVHTQINEMQERVESLEKAHKQFMDRVLESLKDQYDVIVHNLDELVGRVDDLKLDDKHTEHRAPSTIEMTHNPDEPKHKRRCEKPTTDQEAYQWGMKLEQYERELHELDIFLKENVVRERHFEERTMKQSEYYLMCVYCYETGVHYSDACPKIRTVAERIEVLRRDARCLICLEQHEGDRCRKEISCFYCKNSRARVSQNSDHHASICIRPEQLVNAQQQRRKVKEEIEMCYKFRAEREAQRCQCHRHHQKGTILREERDAVNQHKDCQRTTPEPPKVRAEYTELLQYLLTHHNSEHFRVRYVHS